MGQEAPPLLLPPELVVPEEEPPELLPPPWLVALPELEEVAPDDGSRLLLPEVPELLPPDVPPEDPEAPDDDEDEEDDELELSPGMHPAATTSPANAEKRGDVSVRMKGTHTPRPTTLATPLLPAWAAAGVDP